VGLKPTYGRVSRYGLVAFASSLDCVGPLGRTVADCAALLQEIAGPDPRDATCLDEPVPRYDAVLSDGVDGLRIGVPRPALGRDVQGEVRRAFGAALELLRQLGARTVEVEIEPAETALAAYHVIASAEASANLARYDGLRFGPRDERETLAETRSATRGAGFGAEVKRRVMLGSYVLSAGYRDRYYLKAQRVRARIAAAYDRLLTEQVDLIATPTSPTTAFRVGERLDAPLEMYRADSFTLAASLAGLPAISVPCGFGDGLPIGLQLIGRRLGESLLLAAAAAYEGATDWHQRWPPGLAPAGGG
jgi:aspartyl-tRNA(Asn)/glutamyl-tRNA(Gln) amidotransferase subunit A